MIICGYEESHLPNGLRVATETMSGSHTIALAISVDVGARHETAEENGISHFLEHMAFKGTKTRSAQDIAEAFDDVGASLNAYTSAEHTVYYARFLPKDLELAVTVLADILQNSTFEEAELERERNVILQEIAMHHDSPEDLVFDYFHETVYPNQPVGRSIIGTPERVSAFTADDMRAYMKKHYCPRRMVISAAGNVDHQRLVCLVENAFEYTSAGQCFDPALARYQGGDRREVASYEQMHLVLGVPGLSYNDPDFFAMQVLSTALGGGMSSRLFQEVREKRGLAYNIYSFQSSFVDSGMFGMYAGAAERSAAELAPVLCHEMVKLAQDGISANELERAVNQHTAGLHMLRESVSGVAEWIGKHLLVYGAYRNTDDLCAAYEAVTRNDVQRVMQRLLSMGDLSCTALGPQKGLTPYEQLNEQFRAFRT